MLFYQLLDDCEGLVLMGDYSSLKCLHAVLLDVESRTPLLRHKEDGTALSSLAYEVRKAYEQMRERIQPPELLPERGVLFGVGEHWLVLLAASRLLRISLGYIDHDKRTQAITYALEAVLEDGMKEAFGDDAHGIKAHLEAMSPDELNGLGLHVEQFLAWNAEQRKRYLGSLLAPSWVKKTAKPESESERQ